jgi:hypothetical protein
LTGSSATDFVVDEPGGRLFFFAGGDVESVALASPAGPPQTIVTATPSPKALAFDGTSVFWANAAVVSSCALPACATGTKVVTSPATVDGISVDGNVLYFGTAIGSDAVRFGSKVADASATDFAPGDHPRGVSGLLYWASGAALEVCTGGAPCPTPRPLANAGTTIDEIRVDAVAVYFIAGSSVFRVAR